MATLTGTTIQSTYDSLLKVTDNDSITGSLKRITDGLGNNTPLYLSSSAVEIVSALNVIGNITATNLSGTNTGDETKASIESKLGAATSSNSGYLTSTDWSTFNNKIAGTGTLNKLAKFSSSSSIADSTITDTGSAVTIGVATSVTGSLTASSIIKSGGTASQILAADGSVITAGTNITISGGTISSSGGISGSGTTNTIPKFTGSTSLGNSNITDSGTLITAGSNTYINGRLGVGITASSLYGVVVTSPISGGTNLFGVLSNGQIQSDATNSAAYYGAVTNTVAGSYTIPVVRHFIANQGTIGAGSIITTQTGFEAAAALTAGVSNYGFRGQLVAAIDNYNLFMNGTAKNYMTGDLGVGSSQNFVSSGPILTTTLTNGGSGYVDSTYTDVASVANSGSGVGALFTVVVSGGIVTSATLTWAGSNYRISDTITISNTLLGGTGSGLVITVATVDSSQLKVSNANGGDITLNRADSTLALNDNIGSIKFENNDTSAKSSGLQARISAYGQGAAGGAYLSFFTRSGTAGTSLVEAMRILDNSNVNIVNGRLGIGASSLPNSSVNSSRAITGSTTSIGFVQSGTVQTDVTTTAFGFLNELRTVDAAFTLSTYTHYGTSQASIGASSAITTQIGFNVPSSFTGATNNYGFRGLIGAGTNRWNLYMDGTANNYLAGNLGIGTTTPSYPLQVRRAGGAGSLGISIDGVGTTDRTVQYFAIQDSATGVGSGHAFYYRPPSSTTDTLGLFLNEDGNVGIGTSSPSQRLHIGGVGSAIAFDTTGAAGTSIIQTVEDYKLSLKSNRGTSTEIRIGDSNLEFFSNSTERMRITSGGLVGIGTSAPVVRLNIIGDVAGNPTLGTSSGNFFLAGNNNLYGMYGGVNTTTGNAWLQVMRNDSATAYNLLLQPSGGNVGIGTGSPSNILHASRSATSDTAIIVSNAGTASSTTTMSFVLQESATPNGWFRRYRDGSGNTEIGFSDALLFSGNVTSTKAERMRITSAGNVGIGTSSPSYKLDTYGQVGITSDSTEQIVIRTLTNTNRQLLIGYNYTPNYAYLQAVEQGIAYRNLILQPSGGLVGIGTSSPGQALQVNGRIRVSPDGTNGGDLAVNDGGLALSSIGAAPIEFFTSNYANERMRITSSGNVGIGTTSPNRKLNILVSPSSGEDDGINLSNGSTRFIFTRTGSSYTYRGVASNAGMIYSESNISLLSDGSNITFHNGSGECMRLNTSNNLLIGTTSDLFNNAKLQVNGGMTYLNLFNRRTASYTLSASDQNYIVEMNVGSANNLTVPPNSSVAFPIGTEIAVLQYGAGQTTIVAGSGVTLKSKSNALKISGQYAGCTLVKVGTDEWYVVGDLTL